MGDGLAGQHGSAQDRHATTDAARPLPAYDTAGALPGCRSGRAGRIARKRAPVDRFARQRKPFLRIALRPAAADHDSAAAAIAGSDDGGARLILLYRGALCERCFIHRHDILRGRQRQADQQKRERQDPAHDDI